jgi:hypothetical protein
VARAAAEFERLASQVVHLKALMVAAMDVKVSWWAREYRLSRLWM